MSCCDKNVDLISGDNSEAFGQNLLRITLRDTAGLLDNHTISKAELRIGGGIIKKFENPQFPLIINLSSEESSALAAGQNMAYLALWDEESRKLTAEGGQVIVIGVKKV